MKIVCSLGLLLYLLFGCASTSPYDQIVGQWHVVEVSGEDVRAKNIIFTFNNEKTLETPDGTEEYKIFGEIPNLQLVVRKGKTQKLVNYTIELTDTTLVIIPERDAQAVLKLEKVK